MVAKLPFRERLPLNEDESVIITDHIAPTSFPLHFHREYELVFFYNCKGIELTIGTIKEKADNIELVLIAPNIPHGWKFPENPKNARILTIQFNGQFLIDALKKKNSGHVFSEGFSTIFFSSKTANQLSEKLTGLITRKKKNNKTELKHILQFITQSPDKRTIFGTQEKVYPELTALDEYLAANYNRKITLNDACSFTGMKPSTFSRYINKHTGKPFIIYFNNIKLSISARHLCETDEKVAVIALLSGFTNLANFNRLFKDRYGLTPLKYRALYYSRKKII